MGATSLPGSGADGPVTLDPSRGRCGDRGHGAGGGATLQVHPGHGVGVGEGGALVEGVGVGGGDGLTDGVGMGVDDGDALPEGEGVGWGDVLVGLRLGCGSAVGGGVTVRCGGAGTTGATGVTGGVESAAGATSTVTVAVRSGDDAVTVAAPARTALTEPLSTTMTRGSDDVHTTRRVSSSGVAILPSARVPVSARDLTWPTTIASSLGLTSRALSRSLAGVAIRVLPG